MDIFFDKVAIDKLQPLIFVEQARGNHRMIPLTGQTCEWQQCW